MCVCLPILLSSQTPYLRASIEDGVNLANAWCLAEEGPVGIYEDPWGHEHIGPGKTSTIAPSPTPMDRKVIFCIFDRSDAAYARGENVTDATCEKYKIGCTYQNCLDGCTAADTTDTRCQTNCHRDCMSSCQSRRMNNGCMAECDDPADDSIVDEW
jgi:hypothetical protein